MSACLRQYYHFLLFSVLVNMNHSLFQQHVSGLVSSSTQSPRVGFRNRKTRNKKIIECLTLATTRAPPQLKNQSNPLVHILTNLSSSTSTALWARLYISHVSNKNICFNRIIKKMFRNNKKISNRKYLMNFSITLKFSNIYYLLNN